VLAPDTVALAPLPFCAGPAPGPAPTAADADALGYAAPALDMEKRSVLELYDDDDVMVA